ncbi:hypothetical protein [Pseudooceanicola aestuarii]|uniref:hypothetical protein n=1 Tax=Pseudooceanicola aestuarii TaxID=2697319 RepID=UPI0013D16293|nr:hypothetical protein [Pseudooceanicola aestuarii]
MRAFLIGFSLAGLAACQPAVPDSAAGVGFGNYDSYRQSRETQLQGGTAPGVSIVGPAVSTTPLDATGGAVARTQTPATTATATGDSDAAQLARDTQAALAASNANSGEAPLNASPSNPAPEAVNSLGISRENDFSAVDAQRSIENDAERIARNRAQYEQVAATDLPPRTESGPNIVAYALKTTHPQGKMMHRRGAFASIPRAERNCAKYPSPDLAQSEFLSRGGPERDRLNLDPDGDGYACSWDPRPFRKAAAQAED